MSNQIAASVEITSDNMNRLTLVYLNVYETKLNGWT